VTAGVTVAVKVMIWLTEGDGSDETTAVEVAVLPTVSTSAAELLKVKFASPLYLPTMLMELAERNVALQAAVVTPAAVATVTGEHGRATPLLVKDTVPVGAAEPLKAGVTTAVKVTCWLTVGALGTDEIAVVVPDADTVRAGVRLSDPLEKF
jgi:hypothetical protein